MPGISGRRIDAAYAISNTWGVAATVTQQLLLMNTEGFDNKPDLVDDESFGPDYIGLGDIGDHQPITPTLEMLLRFDQGSDVFLAAALGSAANPTVVSSQAATSLVAYSHAITMAPEAWRMFTLATNFVQYVQEIRTFKVAGFKFAVGQNGRILASYPIVGDKTVYTSTTNPAAAVTAATVATPGSRAYRRVTRLRMNIASAGALGASDEMTLARDFSIEAKRVFAMDPVLNSDTITEADDDGFWGGTIEVTFARMNTVTANSLMAAYQVGTAFKADVQFLGSYINSFTQRSILLEMPALQVPSGGYKAVAAGQGQVRPTVTFALKGASAAPTGMTGLTDPLRATIINARSTNLLT